MKEYACNYKIKQTKNLSILPKKKKQKTKNKTKTKNKIFHKGYACGRTTII
jgi:hypothetical protein